MRPFIGDHWQSGFEPRPVAFSGPLQGLLASTLKSPVFRCSPVPPWATCQLVFGGCREILSEMVKNTQILRCQIVYSAKNRPFQSQDNWTLAEWPFWLTRGQQY